MLPAPLHSSMFPVAAMGAAGNEAVRDYAHRMGIEVPKAPRVPSFGTRLSQAMSGSWASRQLRRVWPSSRCRSQRASPCSRCARRRCRRPPTPTRTWSAPASACWSSLPRPIEDEIDRLSGWVENYVRTGHYAARDPADPPSSGSRGWCRRHGQAPGRADLGARGDAASGSVTPCRIARAARGRRAHRARRSHSESRSRPCTRPVMLLGTCASSPRKRGALIAGDMVASRGHHSRGSRATATCSSTSPRSRCMTDARSDAAPACARSAHSRCRRNG